MAHKITTLFGFLFLIKNAAAAQEVQINEPPAVIRSIVRTNMPSTRPLISANP